MPVPPSLSIDDAFWDGWVTNLDFTVYLSVPSSVQVTVNYTTADGSAVAGSDYDATSGTLTFAPGVITQPISVHIISPITSKPQRTFSINLSQANGAIIADGQAIGTLPPCGMIKGRCFP
jgi:hypothetical protein